jgi:hypothetical protein
MFQEKLCKFFISPSSSDIFENKYSDHKENETIR